MFAYFREESPRLLYGAKVGIIFGILNSGEQLFQYLDAIKTISILLGIGGTIRRAYNKTLAVAL